MKREFVLAALVATCISPWAVAQTGPGMTAQPGTVPHTMGDPGIGPGMMGGINPAALAGLDLTEEQRGKVTEIQRDLKRKLWSLMGSLRELRWKLQDAMMAREIDADAARKTYDAMAAHRKEMFEAGLDARKRIEAVLTKEQLEQLKQRKVTPPPAGGGVFGRHPGSVSP
jgi:Spy/CpxP family protein refolding chaperone